MSIADSGCPGVVHPSPAKDGFLVRIRVPGGLLSARQFLALARLTDDFGSGFIDITARANLQLRGIRNENISALASGLAESGLLPSATHDRIRNIIASPFSGIDVRELVDMRPVVRALDEGLLAEPSMANLPAKFSFSLDGGGRPFELHGTDLGLTAVNTAEGVLLHLLVANHPTNFGVVPAKAAQLLLAAAQACLSVARELELSPRGSANWANAAAYTYLLQAVRPLASSCPPPPVRPIPQATAGIFPTSREDFVCLVPSVPLGRMSARQMVAVGRIAEQYGEDIRLAPWHGIVIGGIPRTAAGEIRARLEKAELFYNPADGYHGIAACVGAEGCAAALADVRNDASRLAQSLSGLQPLPTWNVHIAGCEKRCGLRTSATVELLATPAGYDVSLEGVLATSGCSSDLAIQTTTAFRTAKAV
jgi:precorrin-3B synthase